MLPSVAIGHSIEALDQQHIFTSSVNQTHGRDRQADAAIEKADFTELLRGLGQGEAPLLEQAPGGAIMLGPEGERLTASHDFYANFSCDEEWRLVHLGRALGTLPIVNALVIGSIIGFAGRRLRAAAVDDRAKVVEVEPHRAGRIPKFDRLGREPIHDRLAAEILAVMGDIAVHDYWTIPPENCWQTAAPHSANSGCNSPDTSHRTNPLMCLPGGVRS